MRKAWLAATTGRGKRRASEANSESQGYGHVPGELGLWGLSGFPGPVSSAQCRRGPLELCQPRRRAVPRAVPQLQAGSSGLSSRCAGLHSPKGLGTHVSLIQ